MKRRWAGLQAVRLTPEDSSAEVTSSSTTLVMSPANSLASTDIGEVDLEFWDLDLNAQNHARNLIIQNGYGVSGHTIIAKSDSSSMSGFFRRSITKNAVYQCKYGNNCDIDMYMRRKCQECRLKKCLTVGMRPECVVPETQCAVKRKEKKALKEKDKPNSTTNGSPTGVIKIEPELSDSEKSNGVKPISPEQEELIHRLVYFQNEYEHPSEEDVKRILNQPMEDEDQREVRFRHITEITILTVQLIVEFAKRLPGFDKLLREDQIALLKACSSEVMMFRMARRYDFQTDSILFSNNQPYSRDSYNLAGMGETIEDLLHFCRTMYSMKVDNAEYALLTAIVIFSERPSLMEGWKVEKIQEIYLEALKAYVDNRRKPRAHVIFAKLVSVLTELRTLGNQNAEMCFSLKLKNKKLPPFLAEIWDVDVKT
ncbi:hypothetical protein ABEB36_008397 [Hypothenemus hampei]|uniref:Ecdysone receptor n=1 Tax=Hypothenemus hampei TaxID=57062 RepID=A0ABD1EM44_HYPHA